MLDALSKSDLLALNESKELSGSFKFSSGYQDEKTVYSFQAYCNFCQIRCTLDSKEGDYSVC